MEPNHQADHQVVNSAARTPPYTVLTFGGKNYRVLSRQHNGFLQISKTWNVFWFLFASFMLGSALILFFQQQIPFILTVCIGCLCIFTIFAFYKRTKISLSIFYSSINLLVWLVPVTILAFLQVNQLIIPFCFYILIQTLISIKFMSNKSQMIGKFLLVMETLIIILKADDKIHSSWRDVLFINVVFFLFLSTCVVFMTGYLFYMKFKQNQENLIGQKIPGVLLVYFNTIAFCLVTGIPLFNILLEIKFWIICLTLSFLFAVLGSYIYFYRKKIVVFFCTLNEIKAFDQIISFEPIEDISNSKSQSCKSQKKKNHQPLYLYRVSQNWLTKDPLKAHQNVQENPQEENQQQIEQDLKLTDCTVCLDSPAEVVWMPCGHLTVCMQCCSFMFEKKNFNCVLCKKTPQQIFMIDTKLKEKKEPIISQNSLQISIQKENSTVISGSIVLGSQNNMLNKKEVNKISISSNKQKQNPNNKLAYLVKEGYNIKII